MGADGGLTWMRVTNRPRFWELVQCLGFTGSIDDGYEDKHDAYLEANSLPEDYVVLPYGTNHELQGFDTIREMLLEAKVEGFSGKRTFVDLAYDTATDPCFNWRSHYYRDYPGGVYGYALAQGTHFGVLLTCNTSGAALEKHIRCMGEHPVYSMTLQEWASEVDRVVRLATYGEAETWT